MLGKRVGDEITVRLPRGKKEYEITEIEYISIFSLKKNIRSEKDFGFK